MARGSQATQSARARGKRAPEGGVARGGALAQSLRSSAPSRFLFARPTLSAGLLLALPVLVYLWPVLVGGDVFSATAVLYKLPPWQPFRPADVASFENYLLADVPLAIYPWREFARELLRSGTLPAWNPHVLAGVPFMSNPQTGLYTPFSLPLWLLPFDWALGFSAALKLWVAGFGTYLLTRELRLGFLPGLLGGLSFGFCSLLVTWLTMETIPSVVALLPAMLWLVERTLRRGSVGAALGLAAVTAAALSGGHPGSQVHVLLIAGLYALLRVGFADGGAARRALLRPLALVAGGVALGLVLVGVVLLPELLSSRGTVGTSARTGASGTLPGLREMPFDMIRTVVVPDWWGRPSAFETPDSPTQTMFLNYLERTFYAGVVPLLLAGVALVGWRGGAWRRIGPFAVLAALGLAIPLHAPGLWWLVTHLPGLELVQNQRLHFMYELAVAVLAAFGLQALLERPAGERWRIAVPAGAVVVGLGLVAGGSVRGDDVGRVFRHFATGADYARAGVVELTSVAWLVLLAGSVAGALFALRRWPARAGAIGVGLVLLAALDMLHFASGFNPSAPASAAIPPKPPAVAFLQRHVGDGRVTGVELALPPDWSMRYGLNDVRGYDPPYPTRRYFDLWRTATPAQDEWRPQTIDAITPETMRVMSALGARYVLAAPGTAAPEGDPSLRELRTVYDAREAVVFENERAVPRAQVAPEVLLAADEDATRAALVGRPIDLRTTAVVEEDQGGGAAGVRGAHGTVRIVEEENSRVLLRATLDRPGLVILNDTLTDGWSVRVDGREARALRANGVMRGVEVGAGTHSIEWRYRVPGLRAGLVVSVVGLLLFAAGLVVVVRQSRRRRAEAAA